MRNTGVARLSSSFPGFGGQSIWTGGDSFRTLPVTFTPLPSICAVTAKPTILPAPCSRRSCLRMLRRSTKHWRSIGPSCARMELWHFCRSCLRCSLRRRSGASCFTHPAASSDARRELTTTQRCRFLTRNRSFATRTHPGAAPMDGEGSSCRAPRYRPAFPSEGQSSVHSGFQSSSPAVTVILRARPLNFRASFPPHVCLSSRRQGIGSPPSRSRRSLRHSLHSRNRSQQQSGDRCIFRCAGPYKRVTVLR